MKWRRIHKKFGKEKCGADRIYTRLYDAKADAVNVGALWWKCDGLKTNYQAYIFDTFPSILITVLLTDVPEAESFENKRIHKNSHGD